MKLEELHYPIVAQKGGIYDSSGMPVTLFIEDLAPVVVDSLNRRYQSQLDEAERQAVGSWNDHPHYKVGDKISWHNSDSTAIVLGVSNILVTWGRTYTVKWDHSGNVTEGPWFHFKRVFE